MLFRNLLFYSLLNFIILLNSNGEKIWSQNNVVTTIRLSPGSDLKHELLKLSKEENLKAATILSGVGSLKEVNIRLASADANGTSQYFTDKLSKYEIVSLVGTLEGGYGHIHISLSDKYGKTIGGHLSHGCLIYTTAEITILENKNLEFTRSFDQLSGYDELKVLRRRQKNPLECIWQYVNIIKSKFKKYIVSLENIANALKNRVNKLIN